MLRRSPIDRSRWFCQLWRNRLHTALLLAFLGGYLLSLGWLIWGPAAAIWLLVIGGTLLVVPTGSPRLLMKLHGARPLSRWQAPQTYQIIHQLAQQAELGKLPKLYYLPMRQPNAMAVGSHDEPIIAISEGLLRLLNQRELIGVLAHEISHLRNDDLRVMRLADLASRLTNSLSLFGQLLLLVNLPLVFLTDVDINWLLVFILIFAPQVSTLAQLGLSRVREYNADLGAATLTGDPEDLASTLQKIQRNTSGFRHQLLPGYSLPHWLRTHPPTKERVRRLLELSRQEQKAPRWRAQPAYRPPIIQKPVRAIQMNSYPERGIRGSYRNRCWHGY